MTTSIETYQSSLVLRETIAINGIFPSRDSFNSGMTLGMLHTYAFNVSMNGAPATNGQILAISQNTALFSLLGTSYGGNGQTTFALPDLGGRAAVGEGQGPGLTDIVLGEQTGISSVTLTQQQLPSSVGGSFVPVDEDRPELSFTYAIRTDGIFPSANSGGSLEMIGSVVKFAGNFAPGGYLECNGQLLSIAQYDTLFQIIGTTYGGDGQSTFALPDLRGRTIVGSGGNYTLGQVAGSEDITIAQSNLPVAMGGSGVPVNNVEPSLAMNYIIALQGIFPSQSGSADPTEPMIGEIVTFAGNFAPKGFALCQGQLLSIAQNQALFSLLGTTFGGDGRTTFALPDLRGREILGQDSGFTVGQLIGSDATTLTLDNIPDLNYAGTNAGATHYGGNGNDIINALGGVDTIIANGGNDIITGGAGSDTINGGPGTDTAVFSSHHGEYAVSYNVGTQTYTVADQRSGSPDGSDAVSQVESFQFSDGAFVPNTAGGLTQTVTDALATTPWASQVSSFDSLGSLALQTVTNDNGTYWVNEIDTTNSASWLWRTSGYDPANHLMTQAGTNDDGTHFLTTYDVANAYSWADITITFDASWNQISLTGTRDDGTHAVNASDIAALYDTLTWFATPYDLNWTAKAVNTTLIGGGNRDVLFGHAGNDTIDGAGNADLLAGGLGKDTFVFHPGEANGDTVLDFNANRETDAIQFVGYGAGATFTQIDATHWQVNYNGGASHDVITFANAPDIPASEYTFI